MLPHFGVPGPVQRAMSLFTVIFLGCLCASVFWYFCHEYLWALSACGGALLVMLGLSFLLKQMLDN